MAAELILLATASQSSLRRQRLFLPRSDHLDKFDDQRLIKKYRFPKDEILRIIEICSPHLDRLTCRNVAIGADVQILLALRYADQNTTSLHIA